MRLMISGTSTLEDATLAVGFLAIGTWRPLGRHERSTSVPHRVSQTAERDLDSSQSSAGSEGARCPLDDGPRRSAVDRCPLGLHFPAMTSDYRDRRLQVAKAIEPGVLVLFSAPLALRNNDVEHEYRQDSDFYYLTGFDEPESVLVIRSSPSPKTVLFVRPRDPERETMGRASRRRRGRDARLRCG